MMTKNFNIYIFMLLSFTFIAISFLVYQQLNSNINYRSDTKEHLLFAFNVAYSPQYYIPHPLWHHLVYSTSLLSPYSMNQTAIFISTCSVTAWVYLVYLYLKISLKSFSNLNLTLITAIIIFIGPLNIPWIDPNIYLGQGSPNIWHNVTLWIVKPFNLLSIIYFVKTLHKSDIKNHIFLLAFSIISIYAKPSFIIIFLPTILIFLFLNKKKYRPKYFWYILLFIISCLILVNQYMHTFVHGDSHMIIDFLGVWSSKSKHILLSIFLGLAFPISFLLLEIKIIKNDYIQLSWIMTLVAILIYASFAQTGRFYSHGNFGWSYMIAMSLLYIFSIQEFFYLYNDLSKYKKYFLSILLGLQVFIRIYYFYEILHGVNPISVTLTL